jgi:hypothetical protein
MQAMAKSDNFRRGVAPLRAGGWWMEGRAV